MSICVIILAGGEGSRLAGRDKGWLHYRGTAMIEQVLARLQGQVDDIVISCNRNKARYQALGHTIVSDDDQDFRGPLAGIAAAAPLCKADYILLCPCDTPQLPTDLVARLLPALQRSGADAAIPVDTTGRQYLSTLLRQAACATAADSLAADNRAVKRWLASLNTVDVDFSDDQGGFLNINHPGELEA